MEAQIHIGIGTLPDLFADYVIIQVVVFTENYNFLFHLELGVHRFFLWFV